MIKDFDFSQLADNSLEAKIILQSGTILYANRAFVQLLGFHDRNNIIGADIFDFIHPDFHKEAKMRRLQVLEGGIAPLTEQKMIRVDGLDVDVEVFAAPFLHKGEILVQAIIRDLSEHKKNEELLRHFEKLSLTGEMAAGIVHEIRNPLTSMKGFLHLMKSFPKPEYIDIILQELKQIEVIADELLHFSKPVPDILTQLNIKELVSEVVNFSAAESFRRSIKIEVIDEDEGCLTVTGNRTQLKQVLLNIIKNAIEAINRNGHIRVHVKKYVNDVSIYITDNGNGIPDDQLNNIGQSFFTSKETGTGLGMMVSFNIIKNHNGSIEIESEENKGTTFKITLPLANEAALPKSP